MITKPIRFKQREPFLHLLSTRGILGGARLVNASCWWQFSSWLLKVAAGRLSIFVQRRGEHA